MAAIQVKNPLEAWALLNQNALSILLDVRDPIEFALVGHAPGALNVPWKFAPQWAANPEFVSRVLELVPNVDTPLFLMCRSGQRSLDAAKALEIAGYTNLINVDEGFEGPLDQHKHRSSSAGWRFHKLPWIQN